MRKVVILILVAALSSCESTEDRRERFFQLGNRALSEGSFEKAIVFYDQALKEDPNYAPAINNRGVAQIESGHSYEAILDYNKAIALDPNYQDAILNRAYAYEEIGQFQKALDDVSRVEQINPDSSFVHFYKGLVLTKLKSYDQAYESFQRSDALNPLNPETLINMATIHYFKGQLGLAEEKVEEVLALSSEDANARNLLSLIALERENYMVALSEINRALDIVPSEPFFINNRGYVYLQMDSLDLAIEDINSSIISNPNNGWAYRNKGIYLYRRGEFEDAIRLFERAIETKEFIDEVYYYLGLTYQLNGEQDKACEAWQTGERRKEESSKQMLDQNCG